MRRNSNAKLRVANVSYLVTHPFHLLGELDFADYEENRPFENARKLREGLLDVALIPTSEFAAHGGYVGLDYGLACGSRSDSVILCAHVRPQKLDTVYLQEGTGAASLMLALLFRERWRNSPRFIRVAELPTSESLRENEGVLLLDTMVPAQASQLAVQEDLAAAWWKLTGKPFVFLVWATRPDTLSLRQLHMFREVFQRASAAVEPLIGEAAVKYGIENTACKKYWSPDFQYYLDEGALQGLDCFLDKAATHHALPRSRYRSATFTLFEKEALGSIKQRPLEAILEDTIAGQRISISDGIRLAEQASMADLGMAADLLRGKLYPERTVSQLFFLDPHEPRDIESLESDVAAAVNNNVRHLMLLPTELHDLTWYEDTIAHLHTRYPVWIEAFTVPQLYELSKRAGISFDAAVSRLVTAGLNAVSAFGSGMLTTAGLQRRKSPLGVDQWLEGIRWIHRFGASMSCCMTLSQRDSWEERVVHLHALRALQDEIPGFGSFCIEFSPHWQAAPRTTEIRLRAYMLARLFLDNISSVQESAFIREPLSGVLSLCFGANEVSIELGRNSLSTADQTIETLRSLGMDFTLQVRSAHENLVVH